MSLSQDEKRMLINSYENSFSQAVASVKAMKSGNTGHIRQDVALNQLELGLAMKRSNLTSKGINVKYFNPNDY